MPKKLEQPNIIWLVSDHQAYANHRLISDKQLRRPVQDRLSKEGVNFTHAYTTCPLCTPARASMLTGVYPHRHGMTANAGRFGSRMEFESNQKLISHYLKKAGYKCGYFGKWHCGDDRIAKDYGFEGFSLPGYGYPYKSEKYKEYLLKQNLEMPQVLLEDFSEEFLDEGYKIQADQGNWFDSEAGSAILIGDVETHEAFFISDIASEWLKQQQDNYTPFFLRVDVWGPHAPYLVASPFANSIKVDDIPKIPNFESDLNSRPKHHRDYRDFWEEKLGFSWHQWRHQLARCYEHGELVEAGLEKILTTLDQIGLTKNTVVIYTADHGDALASNGGVANKGAMMVEETVRIPLVVRYPGHLEAGTDCSSLVNNMDIVPTVLEFAGADFPSPIDGRSLIPLLQKKDEVNWPNKMMLMHHGLHLYQFQRMLCWENYKYVAQLDGFEELYDIACDPFELDNLSSKPTYQNLLSDIRKKLISEMKSLDDNSEDSSALIEEILRKK